MTAPDVPTTPTPEPAENAAADSGVPGPEAPETAPPASPVVPVGPAVTVTQPTAPTPPITPEAPTAPESPTAPATPSSVSPPVTASAPTAPTESPAATSAPATPPTPATAQTPATPATAQTPATPATSTAPHEELASIAATYGRVEADGTVHVRTASGEVVVGQYAAGTPEEGLAFFVRKYVDLRVEIDLSLRRLRDGKANVDAVTALIARIREELTAPKLVGDLAVLTAKADELAASVASRRAEVAEQRARQKAEALAKREAIAAEAESLAGSTQWKSTGDRFKTLLDDWKALPRGDRAKEQDLWKRFSTARSAFDKARRTHFAKLDAERSAAKSAKSTIIEQAEALATSTDWVRTAQAYRDLMTQWKAAPRGGRADEDALWARFRAAQDAFFTARSSALEVRDSEHKANLAAKEALAAEAEALLPVTAENVKAVTASLRAIQSRWEKVGHVPRQDKERIDGRLRRVEDAVRRHEQEQWRRSDPEARDRASGIVTQFRASLDKLEAQHSAALAKGDSASAASLEERIRSTRDLLAAAESAASEFTR